jgi:hypoxanthine phosphoribosyltransferase
MKYIELSIKNTIEESNKLALKVNEEFQPDVIVFIAKGSYLIGETISEFFQVPLVEIFAVREGNKLKDAISPILKIIPKNIKNYLRKKELESGIHSKKPERNIYLEKGSEILGKSGNILIVDDSVDTGYTARQVCEYISENYSNTVIRFASLNYFKESEKIFKVDFNNFENHAMNGPWSKDSSYYKEFVKMYALAKQRGDF